MTRFDVGIPVRAREFAVEVTPIIIGEITIPALRAGMVISPDVFWDDL